MIEKKKKEKEFSEEKTILLDYYLILFEQQNSFVYQPQLYRNEHSSLSNVFVLHTLRIFDSKTQIKRNQTLIKQSNLCVSFFFYFFFFCFFIFVFFSRRWPQLSSRSRTREMGKREDGIYKWRGRIECDENLGFFPSSHFL